MEPAQDNFLEDLFCKCYHDLMAYANTCLGNPDLAEDMVQDTFHEATNQVDCLLEHPYPERWLIKTLKFKICNYSRTQSRHRKYLVECLDLTVIPSGESVEQLVMEKVSCPVGREIRPDGVGQRQAFVPNSTKIAG